MDLKTTTRNRKYPLVDHINKAYALGLFGMGEDAGAWGIRSTLTHNSNNVDGGYFSEEKAITSIHLMAEFGLPTTNLEIVKKIAGQWCNVW